MTNKPSDPLFVLLGSSEPISSLNFIEPKSPNESIRYLSSGTQNGKVIIWDLKIRGPEIEWRAHDSSVLWIKYFDSANFWTCGRSDSVVLWDITEGAKKKISIPIQNYYGFSQCDISNFESQKLLCVPGPSQESLTIWDVNSNKIICHLTPDDVQGWGSVMQCRWVRCSERLLTLVSYENGNITLWDWANKKVLSTVQCHDNPISLEFDSFLMRGICGTASKKIFVFYIEETTCSVISETAFTITNPGIGCVSSRPDSKIYAVGGWDYRVRLFSWKKHKPLASLLYHKKSIECISFSKGSVETLSKGYLLAAGSCDNTISLWDIYN